GVGVVELDIFKALPLAPLELLAQVLLPTRATRVYLPFAILGSGIGCVQIGPIAAGILFIEEISIGNAYAAFDRRRRIVGNHGDLVVTSCSRSVGANQIPQRLASKRIAQHRKCLTLRRRELYRLNPAREVQYYTSVSPARLRLLS